MPLGTAYLYNSLGYLKDNGLGSHSRALLTSFLKGGSNTLTLLGVPNSASVTYLNRP